MTTSNDGGQPSWGRQEPRLSSVPPFVSSLADEILELCEMVGLHLDPWQQLVLRGGHGVRPDGRLSAPEIGCCVPRQNGKGAILEAVELGRLFVLQSPLTLHSAHQFDTSLEAYKRLRDRIEDTPLLDKQVRRYPSAHGSEGIELRAGPRIRFRTRTKGGGRGFTSDCLILDEAMYLPESVISALVPLISARRYGQIWYTGSAVDQTTMDDGVAFARVRQRGLAGGDPDLAYYEWSVDLDTPVDLDEHTALDPEAQSISNPARGIRIEPATFEREYRSMGLRSYAVERMNVGDWPAVDGDATVIDMRKWTALVDEHSQPVKPVFVFDVDPARQWASIAAVGKRHDGNYHLEVVDRRRGTGWLLDRLAGLVATHRPGGVFCDSVGPAASLVRELDPVGVKVIQLTTAQVTQACGLLFDMVERGTVRHLDTPELASALRGAVKRPLGDAWAWSRKNSSVDITPLVAVTLGLWAAAEYKPIYRSAGF